MISQCKNVTICMVDMWECIVENSINYDICCNCIINQSITQSNSFMSYITTHLPAFVSLVNCATTKYCQHFELTILLNPTKDQWKNALFVHAHSMQKWTKHSLQWLITLKSCKMNKLICQSRLHCLPCSIHTETSISFAWSGWPQAQVFHIECNARRGAIQLILFTCPPTS